MEEHKVVEFCESKNLRLQQPPRQMWPESSDSESGHLTARSGEAVAMGTLCHLKHLMFSFLQTLKSQELELNI